MNFEPQCKTRADLHREMARVLDMCAGLARTSNYPLYLDCVKYNGCVPPHYDGLPHLYMANIEEYEFALAIIEGKPVFRDSRVFDANTGAEFIAGQYPSSLYKATWNPPKPKTVMVNGVEVKRPGEIRSTIDFGYSHPHEVNLRFASMDDAEAFKAALEGKKP